MNKYQSMTDEELFEISILKQKGNGNATPQARAAQRELAIRQDVIKMHSTRKDGSTKRFAYNADYMSFEADNR